MEYETVCYKCGNRVTVRYLYARSAPDIKVLCPECSGTSRKHKRKLVNIEKPTMVGQTIVNGVDTDINTDSPECTRAKRSS